MTSGRNPESLKKLADVLEELSLEKRVSAAKWLEGVILAQNLTAEERDGLVAASNEYVGSTEEAEYVDAVNALMDHLRRVQNESKRALKKMSAEHVAEPVVAV